MDLLAGYDSTSSDDGKHNDKGNHEMDNKNSIVAPSKATVFDEVKQGLNGKVKSKSRGIDTTDKRRGKKLLKLSSVLPEHIWNQLSGTGAGADHIDSDDEEDSVLTSKVQDNRMFHRSVVGNARKLKGEKISSNVVPALSFREAPSKSAERGKDTELLSLLQALQKSKSSGNSSGILLEPSNDEQEATTAFDAAQQRKNQDVSSSEIGHAFVTSTTEFARRKASVGKTAAVNSQSVYNSKAGEIGSIGDMHDNSANDFDRNSTEISKSAHFNDVLSTDTSKLDKAPISISYPSIAPLHPLCPAPTMSGLQSALQGRESAIQHRSHYIKRSIQAVEATTGNNRNLGRGKKLSRKRQMEQMLRAGKINDIQEDHILECEIPTYQPSSELMSSSRQTARVLPTSNEVSGRQRSKHQLNSLLASAASLEAHRAQNPHVYRGGSSGAGANHRSTAKRKYGW